MKQLFLFIFSVVIFCSSCGNDKVAAENKAKLEASMATMTPQQKIDEELIQKYLKEKGLKAQRTDSGIYYIIEKLGTGDIAPTNSVEVHYEGTLLNGSKFDSSYDRGKTISFGLGQVVKGWTEGIPLIKNGGKGTLIIPSHLGYGSRAKGAKIPANSVLVFLVEVFDVK